MMRRRKVSGVFLKFFFTHLIILVIPITILGIISNRVIVNIMMEQVAQEERNEIIKCASDMDAQLLKLLDVGFKASRSQEFSPHILSDFTQNSLSLMEKLRTYKTANSFIKDIYLVSDYSDYVYSTTTTYSLAHFIEQKLDVNLSDKELFKLLSYADSGKLSNNMALSSKSLDGGLYFTYPLPSGGVNHYGYLVFEISRQYLNEFSGSFVRGEQKQFMIVQDNEIISASPGFDLKAQEAVLRELNAGRQEQQDGIFGMEVDGQRINCCYAPAVYANWVCVSIFPISNGMLQINNVVSRFTFAVVVLLLVGILAIYMAAQINYSPIQKLAHAADLLFHQTAGTGAKNELRFLRDLMDETHQSIQESNLEQNNSQQARQYFLLKNLINGVRYEPGELDGLLKDTCLNFYPGNYFAAIFHIHIRNSREQDFIPEISNALNAYPLPGIVGSAANLYRENIIAIYSAENPEPGKIQFELEALRQSLCEKFQVQITLGTGCVKPDLNAISGSFMEASTALDYRFISGKNKTIFFGALKLKAAVEMLYPQPYIDSLCSFVKNGQEKNAVLTIQSLLSYIRENAGTMYAAKFFCQDVIGSVVKMLHDLDIAVDYDILNTDSISLANFETMEDLEHMLQRFCTQCCAHINTLPTRTISDKAIGYIKEHFLNPDFSINGVSEILGISAAHLSRTFKEQKGITINSYIKAQKLDLAKQMLTDTNDSIEKITHLLGYYDCSSFIKKFKGEIGITPGEFRKLHKLSAVPK